MASNSAKGARRPAPHATLSFVIDAPFRGSAAVRRGLLTRGQLAGPRFRRVFPDVYVPVMMLPLDLAALSRTAFVLVEAGGGVLAGYSAAVLLGAACAPLGAPAEVLVGRDTRAHRGLVVHRGTPAPDEVTVVGGCRVTSAARTAWDLARRLPLVEAVVAVDALARRARFDPLDLLALSRAHRGARGCRRVAGVVRRADPRAASPPETRLRLALVDAGLPPRVQYPVRDDSGFVHATVDFAYPAARLAIEYDGEPHFEREQATWDRARDARLADLGWWTVRLTRDDVGRALPRTVALVGRLVAQRAPAA